MRWAAGTSVSPERSLGWLACWRGYHRRPVRFDRSGRRQLTADARVCPRCGSPMVIRTAGRGRYEGQRFWGCSTYPRCKAIIGVQSDIPESELGLAGALVSPAGASAQVEYERYRARNRERLRRQWPFAVG